MVTWAIREAYLNRLTDNGRKFFSLYVSQVFHAELKDHLQVQHPDDDITYYFGYEPLTRQWFGRCEENPAMPMLVFLSHELEYSFEDCFEFIRELCIHPAVQSIDWISAIEHAQNQIPINVRQLEFIIQVKEEGERFRLDLLESFQEDVENETVRYETTPAEALHFYFRPSNKKEGIFITASMIVNFMNAQHPGFWRLSEEETGKLLNSEGFVICKGRHKGARGYFLRYREGWHPGIYMELKEAS